VNIQQINDKIKALQDKKIDLANKISQQKATINVLKNEIDMINKTATVKGQEVRQMIKQLNKKKSDLSSAKRNLISFEVEENNIPYKIKYYEHKRTKIYIPVMDYFKAKAEGKI